MNFSIIIPNYNGIKFLPECLKSLISAIQNCPHCQFEIILIDNASTDNSVEFFNNYFESKQTSNLTTKTHQFRQNYGFAKAVNFGITYSQHDWSVLINNDLTLEPNWFQLISQQISNPLNSQYSVFCGTVLNRAGDKYESLGLDFHYSGKCHNIANHQPYPPELQRTRDPEYQSTRVPEYQIWGSSAALVVYNKSVIQKIGLFDEAFFAYEEDVDVALRLHNFGYKTLLIPSAISYHLGGGTSKNLPGFRAYHDTKNWYYIIIKNFSSRQFFTNFLQIFIQRIRDIKYLLRSTPVKKRLYILPKMYSEIFQKLPLMFHKRKQIQKLLKYKS